MRTLILIWALAISFLGCGHSQDMNEASQKSSIASGKKKRKRTTKQGAKAKSESQDSDGESVSQADGDDDFVDDRNAPNQELQNEDDARDLLIGIWNMDGKSLPPSQDILRLPKDQQAAALAEERSRASQVKREFAEDGTYKLLLGGQSKQVGRYEVLSAKHNVLEVETDSIGPLGSMSETLSIEVNSMELKITDDESRRFKMQRPRATLRR